MRRGRNSSLILGIFAGLSLIGQTGCHQHHYYMTNPGGVACVDSPVSTIAYGDVCTVPEGTAVAAGTADAGAPLIGRRVASGPVVIAGTPIGSSTLISQPRTGLIGGRASRNWRASDPEQRVTLKADGAYDDSSVK